MNERAFLQGLGVELAATRRRDAREAWGLVAVGAVFILLYWAFGRLGLLWVGVGATALAAILAAVLRARGARSADLDALAHRGGDVVWVYTQVGAQSARDATMIFVLENGTALSVLVLPTSGDRLIEAASSVYPTATIGYSALAQDRFYADPASLRVPARTSPLRVAAPVQDNAWLIPHARATMLRDRLLGALGAAMAVLGGLGTAIVLSAAQGNERLMLAALLGVVALAGGALAAWGFRPFERTSLCRALRSGAGLSNVHLVDGPNGAGDVVRLAMVTLRSGRRYTFAVPASRP